MGIMGRRLQGEPTFNVTISVVFWVQMANSVTGLLCLPVVSIATPSRLVYLFLLLSQIGKDNGISGDSSVVVLADWWP